MVLEGSVDNFKNVEEVIHDNNVRRHRSSGSRSNFSLVRVCPFCGHREFFVVLKKSCPVCGHKYVDFVVRGVND